MEPGPDLQILYTVVPSLPPSFLLHPCIVGSYMNCHSLERPLKINLNLAIAEKFVLIMLHPVYRFCDSDASGILFSLLVSQVATCVA